ncbi:MAG TPA: hypothetical protein VF360_06560, partial [Candidatus Methanoperedens sp.]
GFVYTDGNAYGSYVTFTIGNQTGNIINYSVMGTTLFNISITNFDYNSTSSQGSITWVSNTDGSTIIQLHDNPAAVINILTNRGISVTFTLAKNVTAAKEDNFVRIESGGVVGYIVGTGTVTSSISGTQVKLDAAPNSAVVFRAAPVNMPMFDNMYRGFSQEIARNRMGMEIALGRNGTYDSINYSTMMQMRVQSMDRNRISLLFNATEPSGRIIAINLDNTSLIVGAHEMLRIHYDSQPMDCVNDPNIVFNGTDRPLCWISPIQEGVRAQLMIYVPHFSEHTIDIVVEPEGTTTNPSITGVTITPTTPSVGSEMNITVAINNPGASFNGRVEGNVWAPDGTGKYLAWEKVVIPSGISTVTIIGPAGGEESSYITHNAGTYLYDIFLENVDQGQVYTNATDSKKGVPFIVGPPKSVFMSNIMLSDSPTVGSVMTLNVTISNPTSSAFTGTMDPNIWDSVRGYVLTPQSISIAAGGSTTLTFSYTPVNHGLQSYDFFMLSDMNMSDMNTKTPWGFHCMDYVAGIGFNVV